MRHERTLLTTAVWSTRKKNLILIEAKSITPIRMPWMRPGTGMLASRHVRLPAALPPLVLQLIRYRS